MSNPTAAERAGLRVLFLTHAFPRWPGDAAGSFILRLAKALQKERIDVTVLTPHAPELSSRDTIDGVRVVRFRYAPASLETLAYTGTMAEQVRSSWLARGALASLLGAGLWRVVLERYRATPSIIHAHWWFPSGAIGATISAVTSIPLVTTMHGSDVRLARSIKPARAALGWVLGKSRTSTTVSRWLATEAHALAPSRPAPLVAPMPAATDLFFPGGERDANSLLYVGRLNAQKGIEILLRALAQAQTRATLDVVGDGPDRESLRVLSSSLGIADRVVWRGTLPQQDLPALYRRAGAVVVPSREEGLGLVAVESLLCETPVIAFDSGGLRDIVQHEETGLLVREFSAGALALAIEQLFDTPSRAREWGVAGRKSVLSVFAPEVVARNYAKIYRDALAESGAHR